MFDLARSDNTPPPDTSNDEFSLNLERLRLPQNFQDTVGVTRRIVTVPVRKPHRHEFVRVKPDEDSRLQTALLTIKGETDGPYLVAPELWPEISSELVPTLLVSAITRQETFFIWPLRLPRSDGRTDHWSTSALEAAQLAEQRWVSVRANLSVGAYDVFEAQADLEEPKWPNISFQDALKLAFRDRYIKTPEHPVLQKLWGRM